MIFGTRFSLEPETNKVKITKKSIKHLENIEFEITNDVCINFVDQGFILGKYFQYFYETFQKLAIGSYFFLSLLFQSDSQILSLCIGEYFWLWNLKMNQVFLKTNNFCIIQGSGVTFLKKTLHVLSSKYFSSSIYNFAPNLFRSCQIMYSRI